MISVAAIRDRIFDQPNLDAARFALQSAAAAAGAFAVAHATGWAEPFPAVISAVFVVQPSAGGTANAGWNRLLAAAIGAGIGFAMLSIMPPDWGTVAAIGLAMLAVNLIAAFRIDWRYAVIPAAAIALGGGSETLASTVDAAMDIAVGAVVGVLVSILVWPDTAGQRVSRQIRSAVDAVASRLRAGGEADPLAASRAAHERFYENAGAARQTIRRLSGEQGKAAAQALDATERLFAAVASLQAAYDRCGAQASVRDGMGRLQEAATTAICAVADARNAPADAIAALESVVNEIAPRWDGEEAPCPEAALMALASRDLLDELKSVCAMLTEGGQIRRTPFASVRQAAREVVPGLSVRTHDSR